MKRLKSVLVPVVILVASSWAAKVIPNVSLNNADGVKKSFADYAAQYRLVVVVFWDTSCKPCKEELVELNKLLPDYEGLGVVAVACDTARTAGQVKPYFKGQGYNFDTLLDVDGDLQRALGVTGTPHTILATPAGEVVWEHIGYRKGDENALRAEIEKYLNSTPAGTTEAGN